MFRRSSQRFTFISPGFSDPGWWQEEKSVLEGLCGLKDSRMIVESLRLLRANYSVKSFYCNTTNLKTRLQARGYQHNLIEKITSETKFTERKSALQQNEKVRNKILPFFTTYHTAREILKEPPTYLLPKRKIFKRYTRESKTTLNEKSLFTPGTYELCLACQHFIFAAEMKYLFSQVRPIRNGYLFQLGKNQSKTTYHIRQST